MSKWNVSAEDVESLSLKITHALAELNLVSEDNEDSAFDIIEEVVNTYFDSPDYRNYN